MGLCEAWRLQHAMMRKQGRSLEHLFGLERICLNEHFWEKRALFPSSGNLCSFGGPGWFHLPGFHFGYPIWPTAISHQLSRVAAGCGNHLRLGPPVVPFYRFFFVGGVPLLRKIDYRKRSGTLILTSQLEDLVEVGAGSGRCLPWNRASVVSIWVNYNDLTRPHPKWWFMRGMAPNHLISG